MARSFKKFIERRESTTSYKIEKLKLSVALSINRLIRSSDLNKKELAEKIGVSPAYISKALKGDVNFTIESMVKIADALDCNVHINLTNKNRTFKWFEVISTKNAESELAAKKPAFNVIGNLKPAINELVKQQTGDLVYDAA